MRTLLVPLLLLAAVMAGCTEGDSPNTTTPGGGTTTTTPATTTTTTTTTTPPTVPTDPPENVTGTIGDVVVLAAPDRAEAGSDAEVCWRVEGSGTIPHTALHWDVESHPDAAAFSVYVGGAVYPGGAAAADPAGYALPGVFCAPLPVGDQPVYFRAHALQPPNVPGTLSEEKAVSAGPATGLSFVGDLPEVAPAGSDVTLCWQTEGLGHLPHTAIHWDTESHPDADSFQAYEGGAIYPDNATSVAAEGYDAPGPYCSSLTMPDSGVVYFRAHALNQSAGVNNLSLERNVVVGPSVSVYGGIPEAAPGGSAVTVCWRVEGEGSVPHTAIHWDDESHPEATSFQAYDGGAVYPDNQTAAQPPYALPGPFCTDVPVPESGSVFFRAHALVPNERNELSAEHRIDAE